MTRHIGWPEKVNTIKRQITDPCDAPFTVYLETFFRALLRMFIAYFAFDLTQIITGFVAERYHLGYTRGGPHGGRSKKKRGHHVSHSRFTKWLNFDPWDWIGRKVGGWFRVEGEVTGVVLHHFWQIFTIEQEIAYKFFVVELVADFFYNWSSFLAETYYCQATFYPILYATGGYSLEGQSQDTSPVLVPDIHKARGAVSYDLFGGTIGNMPFIVSFWCAGQPYALDPCDVALVRLYNLVTGTVLAESVASTGGGSASASAEVPANTPVGWGVHVEGGYYEINESGVTMLGTGS